MSYSPISDCYPALVSDEVPSSLHQQGRCLLCCAPYCLMNLSEKNNHDSTVTPHFVLCRTQWVITIRVTGREDSTSASAQVSCYYLLKAVINEKCSCGKVNMFVCDRSTRTVCSCGGGRCHPGGADPDSGAWRLDSWSPAEGTWDTEADSPQPSWTVRSCTYRQHCCMLQWVKLHNVRNMMLEVAVHVLVFQTHCPCERLLSDSSLHSVCPVLVIINI